MELAAPMAAVKAHLQIFCAVIQAISPNEYGLLRN
jgi:hypothetical protein